MYLLTYLLTYLATRASTSLVITEIRRECSDSITLKKVTPDGFQCIDAARPLAPDADAQNATLVNHGELALVYRQDIKITKRFLNAAVTTVEYTCGHATGDNAHVLPFGVYRPGSEAVTA